jgi:hypothetical protein
MTDILPEIVQPWQAALVAHRIHRLSRMAVLEPRLPACIFGRAPSPFHFFGCKL